VKVLYIDCFSGISGDMMVGALVDAGASPEWIESELGKLDVSGYRLEWLTVMKEGISATKFNVIITDEVTPNHHHHRHYSDIVNLIDRSNLSAGVKERSKQIFAPIAESEAKIHNKLVADVHFHEVGAVDSIVDIVATAIALEALGIEKVITSAVPLGSGTVWCAHGIYPVPAPATLDIMKNVPIAHSDLAYELTTPTGAGIVVSQSDAYGTIPAMKIASIGYGAGTRDIPKRPNVLRVMIGEESTVGNDSKEKQEMITVLECQLDDMTGEAFGFVMSKLLNQGALDVYYTPVYMKKNRPGILITVLSSENNEECLSDVLLSETTTLGVRKSTWSRKILERKIVTVETPYGEIRLKQAFKDGLLIREIPEYEDVIDAALKHNKSFYEVYNSAMLAST